MNTRRVSLLPFALLGLLGLEACVEDEPADVGRVAMPAASDKPTEVSPPEHNTAQTQEEQRPAEVVPWPEDSPMALLPDLQPLARTRNDDPTGQFMMTPPGTPVDWTIIDGACWIRQWDTPAVDSAYGVTTDKDNNVYVVGYTQGNMGNSGGDLTGPSLGDPSAADVFVRKYTSNGTLVWTRQLGTQIGKNEFAMSVAFSARDGGAVYVAGSTTGAMPPGLVQGAVTNVNQGTNDAFLAKFNADGVLQWTRQLGTTGTDMALGVAVEQIHGPSNADGEVYIVGSTRGNLPGYKLQGPEDAFLVKYDWNGNRKWIRQFGTNTNDVARAVAVDVDTNVYVVGDTAGGLSLKNSASHGPFVNAGGTDVFLTKWTTGNVLVDLDQRGSSKNDNATGVTWGRKDGANVANVYVSGNTLGNLFGVNPSSTTYDGFAMHYRNVQMGPLATPSDLTFVQAKQTLHPEDDRMFGVAADGQSNAYIAWQVGTGLSGIGGLAKYDKQGQLTSLGWAMTPGTENGRAVAADYDKGAYLVGDTNSFFNYNTPQTTTTNHGTIDAFLLKACIGCAVHGPNPMCVAGWGWGDPHLRTFDGYLYDFQADGEFVVAEDTLDGSFLLQARQRVPEFNQTVALYQALATRLGNDRVAIYSHESAELRINGIPTTIAPGDEYLTDGDGLITRRQDGTYVWDWPTGERALFSVYPGSHINLHLLLVPNDRQGAVRGLLGNFDGNADNDFALRNGTTLPSPPTFAQMYTDPGNFADSWRISQGESLFDYEPGQSTATFTDLNAPGGLPNLSDIPAAERAAAEQICLEAGVTDPVLVHQCIMDVSLMGDAMFSEGAARMQWVLDTQEIGPLAMQTTATVYSSNMDAGVGSEWSSNFTCVSPLGDRIMLGEFGDELVTLHVGALPPHGMITVSFDAVIINGWDGDGPLGPNLFGVFDEVEGSILQTTFSNTWSTQSYPGPLGSSNPPGTAANEVNMLFYPLGDSVYNIVLTYPHTSNDLRLHFYAQGLSGINMEAWALDNVNVVVEPAAGP